MSLAILFHFLCAWHVSDINISIIRSLRLCFWITTSVVLFCKDGGFSVSVNLRCFSGVCLVWRALSLCCSWLACFHWYWPLYFMLCDHCVLLCVVCFVGWLVQSQIHVTKYINKALITKQPVKNTTHKRTQWSQSITDSGQNQLKYTYQLQQSDKAHHTKHTPLNTINLH